MAPSPRPWRAARRPQGRRQPLLTWAGPIRAGRDLHFLRVPRGGHGGSRAATATTRCARDESDMTTLQPIEAVEQLIAARERTALRDDSGGAGRWRGGLGLCARCAFTRRPANSRAGGTGRLPPFGVAAAARARPIGLVRRNGSPSSRRGCPARSAASHPGAIPIMESSGGGGFGDALERGPESSPAISPRATSPGGRGIELRVVSSAGVIDAAPPRPVARRFAKPGYAFAWPPAVIWTRDAAVRSTSIGHGRRGWAWRLQAVVEAREPPGRSLRAWSRVSHRAPCAASALRDGLQMLAFRRRRSGDRAVHSGFLVAPR